MSDDPRDAYLERMLEEEHHGDDAPDLTERIATALEKPAPVSPFRRPALQIAASILFFVSIISAIVLVPGVTKPTPKPVTPASVMDLLKKLGGPRGEYASHAEQELVDMGEEAIPHLERAMPDLGQQAQRVIERIRWKDTLLTREQIRRRLSEDRLTRGVVPTEADSPASVLRILEERTGVPIVLLQEPYSRDAGSYLKLNPDTSSFTVLRDTLDAFRMKPLYLEGGVVAIPRDRPIESEKRFVAMLLEHMDTKTLRRRVALAGIVVGIAKDDFGYNPYGSRAKRREARHRLTEWWRSLEP